MAKKINVKLILELRSAGMGRNAIAASRHISKNSVGDVFHIADRMGISYEDIAQMDEDTVYHKFYPDKFVLENLYDKPDYEYVHQELKRTGVTLKLLWQEYQVTIMKLDEKDIMFLKTYLENADELIASADTYNLLDALDELSVATMDENDEITDIGRKAERLIDKIVYGE